MKKRLLKIIKRTTVVLLIMVVLLFSYIKIRGQTFNEAGLNFLSWIKTMKGAAVDLSEIEKENSEPITHHVWSDLLYKNVSIEGRVNYEGFISQRDKFDSYLTLLSDNPPAKNWTKNEKLAYWINAYNAFTVKLIVDHYPVKSIKDIGGSVTMINSAWDIKFFKIGGVDFDLNTIEHEIIRKEFDEPRIHFAVNCASVSCPKLRNEAYEASVLNEQLDDQARYFINNNKNNINKNETKISKLFSWFEGDFTKAESLAGYLKKYNHNFNENLSIEYLDYNWNLNN